MILSKTDENRIARALTKTLNAYEDLIAAPYSEAKKWYKFGNYDRCRLCQLTSEILDEHGNCDVGCIICPIAIPTSDYSNYSCGFVASSGNLCDMRRALDTFFMLPNDLNKNRLIETAKARLLNLIEAIKINGWEYK